SLSYMLRPPPRSSLFPYTTLFRSCKTNDGVSELIGNAFTLIIYQLVPAMILYFNMRSGTADQQRGGGEVREKMGDFLVRFSGVGGRPQRDRKQIAMLFMVFINFINFYPIVSVTLGASRARDVDTNNIAHAHLPKDFGAMGVAQRERCSGDFSNIIPFKSSQQPSFHQ